MWNRWRKSHELTDPPRPERSCFVIADIHGRADLLEQALTEIEARDPSHAAELVFLGDYVDRGPDSAAVLHQLHQLAKQQSSRVICLMGNHERMMLDFLQEPELHARRWLPAGGQETLLSFGIGHPPAEAADSRESWLADQLRQRLGNTLLTWLSQLPLWWKSGSLLAVHAYSDPTRAPAEQNAATLLWARPPRVQRPRADGLWVVHGHTVLPEPRVAQGHIAIDTGAWRGGGLTVAEFSGDTPEFHKFA